MYQHKYVFNSIDASSIGDLIFYNYKDKQKKKII